MGWLERWDRHNQRVLEWHQHQYEEEQRGAAPRNRWKPFLAAAVAIALMKLLRRPLEDLLGVGWFIAIFWSVAFACLWLAGARQRRRRLTWEASRATGLSAVVGDAPVSRPSAGPTAAQGRTPGP